MKIKKIILRSENSIDKSVESGIIRTGGKITESNYLKISEYERQATKYYSERLADDTDIYIILKNTGFSESDVRKIKHHMMSDDIPFRDGSVRKFDADIDQALAWKRLILGENIRESDLLLLKHELAELNIMHQRHIFYEDAHKIANQKYNWERFIVQIIDEDELY